MKRWSTLLVVLAAWPLLTAGGGINPGPPGSDKKIVGPVVQATVVLDVSGNFGAPASIRLSKGTKHAGAVFPYNSFFGLGCQLTKADGTSLTDARFVGPLWWVPPATATELFSELGITIDSATMIPEITDIDNDVCSPNNTSGSLSFDAVIQFAVPR